MLGQSLLGIYFYSLTMLSVIQGVLHRMKLSRTAMKFSNSFFLFLCMIKFSNHFMMTMVIKVFSVYWICYIKKSIGLLCLWILTVGFSNVNGVW